MWKIECLKKCKKCEKYINQKKRIEELEEYIDSILKTQKEIIYLIKDINIDNKKP